VGTATPSEAVTSPERARDELPIKISPPPSASLFDLLPLAPEESVFDVETPAEKDEEPVPAVVSGPTETRGDEYELPLPGLVGPEASDDSQFPTSAPDAQSSPAGSERGDQEDVPDEKKREIDGKNDEKSNENKYENKNENRKDEKNGKNDDAGARRIVQPWQPPDSLPGRETAFERGIFERGASRFAVWLRRGTHLMRRSRNRRVGFQSSRGRVFTLCIILVIVVGTVFAGVRHARRNSYDVLMIQAQAQYEEKQYQSAFDLYRRVSERHRGRIEPILGMARAAEGLENIEQAIDIYHAGLEILPFDAASFRAVLLCERGRLYVVLKDQESAQENFEAAAALDATNFNAWYSLGTVLEERGRLKDALPAYRRALDISPSSAPAREGLGRVSSLLVPPPEDPSVQRERKYSEAVQVGTVALGLKNYEEASKCFAEALAIRSDDVVAWLSFADARQGLRDLTGAVKACERALERDPDNAGARARLAALREKAKGSGGQSRPGRSRRPRSFREFPEGSRRPRLHAAARQTGTRLS
jgi:tetratricopeptide (TPR) repeat protein